MRSFIVMGGCNTLVTQVLLALHSAGKHDCRLLGGTDTRKLRYSLLFRERIEIDFEHPDDEDLLQKLIAIAGREPHAVLLPVDCASVRMISRLGARLPLKTIPLPDVDVMNMLDDKWRFFQFCREHGLDVPDTVYIGAKEKLDYRDVAGRLGTPFILKPANEAGSAGVQVIHSEAQFRKEVLANPAYRFRTLIAQRFIAGTDVCIDLFAAQGRTRAMALRERVGGLIRFFESERMRDIACRIATACSYNGVMNMDARIEEGTGKIFLLESNPRFWATVSASAGAGLNFVAVSIDPPAADSLVVLAQGEFHTRHPLMCPAAWRPMLLDKGGQGRLLRAKMADVPSLGGAVKAMAAKPVRMLPQFFTQGRGTRPYEIQRR